MDKPDKEAVRILIVEDNRGDAILVREALKESNLSFELTHISDGEKGIRLLAAARRAPQRRPPESSAAGLESAEARRLGSSRRDPGGAGSQGHARGHLEFLGQPRGSRARQTAKLTRGRSSSEPRFFLERLERVVHDGAVGGAIRHFPHAAEEGSGAVCQVWEVLAGVRPGLINGALISA